MTMIDTLLSGGAAGVAIVSLWKGIDALTAYLNSRRTNGTVKTTGKCADHPLICIDIATIKERQAVVIDDVKEIKNDVKEIFRTLREAGK